MRRPGGEVGRARPEQRAPRATVLGMNWQIHPNPKAEFFWSLENKDIKGEWDSAEGEGQVRKWESAAELTGSAEAPTYVPLSPLGGMLCTMYCGREGRQLVSPGLLSARL